MPNVKQICYSGNYGSDNNDVHLLCFTIGNVSVYFSCKIPIAFEMPGQCIVRQNNWGLTTGKHLDWIDGGDKDNRVTGAVFFALLNKAFS